AQESPRDNHPSTGQNDQIDNSRRDDIHRRRNAALSDANSAMAGAFGGAGGAIANQAGGVNIRRGS
ncbi:MAG: hypothetical protein AAFY60_15470, partial [Myxococcota bacterium]